MDPDADTEMEDALTGLEAATSQMNFDSPNSTAAPSGPKTVLDPTKFWTPYSNVHTLPTELILRIISYLPPADIVSLARSPKQITRNGVSVSQRCIQNGQSPIRYPGHTARYRAYRKKKALPVTAHLRGLRWVSASSTDTPRRRRKDQWPRWTPEPLFHAAANGDVQMVHLLLRYKASTLPRSTWCPWTPLWIAAKNGYFNVVEILLAHPVKKPHLNGKVTTWEPMRDAAKRGHARVVQTLLNYHKCAWPNLSLGQEGLFWASYGGWELVFNLILDAGAPLSGPCESLDGIPLLGAALLGRNRGIITKLLTTEGVRS
ncbi:ankyrin repeat-containing domain protein [Aspergillus pseudoustus]|uniref:Ankyrin repeat-containing domain protein n=1 Tax=Aspergillus pseudoustus TaxID=1810923 RepID=A0ABR4JAT1_9EURO